MNGCGKIGTQGMIQIRCSEGGRYCPECYSKICPKHKIKMIYSWYSFALYCPKCVDEVEENG